MFSKFIGYNMFETSTAKIRALQYNRKVYDSIDDENHGGGRIITEVFIPAHRICFNSEGYVFPSEVPNNIVREFLGETTVINEMTEIKLSKELVDKVVTIANLEAKVKNEKEALKAVQGYQELFANKPSQEWWPELLK